MAVNSGFQTVTENEVTLILPAEKKQAELTKFYNPRLCILREAVLATLEIEVTMAAKPLLCLDAFTGSGLVGLQWKKHLGESVHVIAADRKLEYVQATCDTNKIVHSDWRLDSLRTTGDLPRQQQKSDEINTCPFTANVVLHHEAFNFVFVQPNGCISNYVDSVFTNLRTDGVACFVTPNIASQCFRSPELILRQYHAHVLKTEYVKEMAARVVIADIARSAAKHCRGVEILYTLCAVDHFLIVVKVTKSTQAAVECVRKCRQVLHCLMCEDRVISPDTNSPIELPYSLMPCVCKANNPGKTAVILGPMWVGNIFSISHLEKLIVKTREKFPKSKLNSILESLLTEAQCQGQEFLKLTANQNGCVKTSCNEDDGQSEEPALKKPKTDKTDNLIGQNLEEVGSGEKMQISDKDNRHQSPDEKECGNALNKMYEDTPLFYYDLHRQRCGVLPKFDKVVTLLRQEGYRASRTHFEPSAIRTNATAKQIKDIIKKQSS